VNEKFLSYLWVGFGSALGGAGRYWISGLVADRFGHTFPWGTIVVNVTGSFVIGALAALARPEGRFYIGVHAQEFLMLGLLGGYTTFSSFSLQTLNLVHEGQWLPAAGNVLLSLALCLFAVWLGYTAGQVLNR
jgi:CrcB protein